MSDRFKFRAWNILHGTGRMFYEFGEGEQEVKSVGVNETIKKYIENDSWYIMQCTGLKDKNGKLIYEGDIYVLHTGKQPTKSSVYYRGVVQRADMAWYGQSHKTIYSKRSRSRDYFYSPAANEGVCTVIGNEFENPELLTKTKDND